MDTREKIEQIRKKVSETSIHIARVPKNTKTNFKQWAKEEFEDDYGMALKWLMDFKDGLLTNPNEVLSDRIDVLTEEITLVMKSLTEGESAVVLAAES